MDWEKLERALKEKGIYRKPTLEEQELFVYNEGGMFEDDEAELYEGDEDFKELNFDE